MALLVESVCGFLRYKVFDTREAMGACAGSEAAAKLKELLREKEEVNVMFAAAPSQNETLETLMAEPEIEWERVNGFHMDEYVGLDENHPAGFRNFLKNAVFSNKNFKSVNLINGNADDPEKEAECYSALLKSHPLDICVLGVGENGHIAFNDPAVAEFHDAKHAKVVELDERCRMQQVHDGCFAELKEVPTHALTVTIPGLCAAEWMYCSVPAATKAEAIDRMIHGEISEECPCTILREQPHAFLYTDKEAGSSLL